MRLPTRVISLLGALAVSATLAPPATAQALEPLSWGNNASCTSQGQFQRPVVLISGTWDGAAAWEPLGLDLQAQGACAFALTYGRDHTLLISKLLDATSSHPRGAVGDMAVSAEQVAEFIRWVATQTPAGRAAGGQVDVVGHSQGGALIRMALERHGAEHVRRVITLAGTNHGILPATAAALRPNSRPLLAAVGNQLMGVATLQQLGDSEVVAHLTQIPDTQPGVDYTVVASQGDLVSVPYDHGFLRAGPGATVDNVTLQQRCGVPLAFGHNDVRDAAPSRALVLNVLQGRKAECQ